MALLLPSSSIFSILSFTILLIFIRFWCYWQFLHATTYVSKQTWVLTENLFKVILFRNFKYSNLRTACQKAGAPLSVAADCRGGVSPRNKLAVIHPRPRRPREIIGRDVNITLGRHPHNWQTSSPCNNLQHLHNWAKVGSFPGQIIRPLSGCETVPSNCTALCHWRSFRPLLSGIRMILAMSINTHCT